MSTILITKGTLLDPAAGTQTPGDLAIANGKILAVGKAPADFKPEHTLDATGCVITPGLVDLRARPGMPAFHGSGALEGELEIAARYGITSIVCPPDTNQSLPLDEAGLVDMLRHGAEQHEGTRLFPLGALTRKLQGSELANLQTLARAGCIGFSQGDAPLPQAQMLLRAMQYAATHGQTLWLRPLDANLGQGVAASGALATRMGLEGVPVAAETIALFTIFELMQCVDAKAHLRIHLQGISSAAGVELIRKAKAGGLPITCDVSINSLHLTDLDVGYFDTRARLNPPLRTQRDRDALQNALADGTIDALVSDHARVNIDGKALPFAQAQPGARGFEVLFSAMLHWQQTQELSLAEALRCLTSRPANILGQPDLGQLTPGAAADVCVVNLQETNTINTSELLAPLTPFAQSLSGFHLQGQIKAVCVRGKLRQAH